MGADQGGDKRFPDPWSIGVNNPPDSHFRNRSPMGGGDPRIPRRQFLIEMGLAGLGVTAIAAGMGQIIYEETIKRLPQLGMTLGELQKQYEARNTKKEELAPAEKTALVNDFREQMRRSFDMSRLPDIGSELDNLTADSPNLSFVTQEKAATVIWEKQPKNSQYPTRLVFSSLDFPLEKVTVIGYHVNQQRELIDLSGEENIPLSEMEAIIEDIVAPSLKPSQNGFTWNRENYQGNLVNSVIIPGSKPGEDTKLSVYPRGSGYITHTEPKTP